MDKTLDKSEKKYYHIIRLFCQFLPQMSACPLQSAMVQCGAGMPVADADIKLASQSCWAGAGLTWAK